MSGQNPYRRALGPRASALHPRIDAYFSALGPGAVGVGEGVFRTVGTPRRWLWPALDLLARRGVVFPTWAHDVPFRIENRLAGGRLSARRVFRFPSGDWEMTDAVRAGGSGVIDELGAAGLLVAAFDVDVRDGALELRSRALGLRIGRMRVRVPRAVAPRVRLVEGFDDASARQQVSLTIDVPLVGRVYEYVGEFDYRVESTGGQGE